MKKVKCQIRIPLDGNSVELSMQATVRLSFLHVIVMDRPSELYSYDGGNIIFTFGLPSRLASEALFSAPPDAAGREMASLCRLTTGGSI
ncbi:hypothetical protein [Nitrosovibrio sp. Nv17]|uniref:hypothetical protein n=1 Tax=Nitrosovibrio sp. Nv17 TaxID=1855339 RepID=UPI001160B7CA|nr:hypothetical protein [Nitrosovibrio sp. Nv17]